MFRSPLFVLITVILSLYHSNLECIRMHLVEEFEGPVVNVDLIDGEVVLQTLQEVRHASLGLHALQTLIFISNISICIWERGASYIFYWWEIELQHISWMQIKHLWHAYFWKVACSCANFKCLQLKFLASLPFSVKAPVLSRHRNRHTILKRFWRNVDTLQTLPVQNIPSGPSAKCIFLLAPLGALSRRSHRDSHPIPSAVHPHAYD